MGALAGYELTDLCPVSNMFCGLTEFFIKFYEGFQKKCLPLLHNFIQLDLNSGSAQVQIQLAASHMFEMVKKSDNNPAWK